MFLGITIACLGCHPWQKIPNGRAPGLRHEKLPANWALPGFPKPDSRPSRLAAVEARLPDDPVVIVPFEKIAPQENYTRLLLSAIPSPDADVPLRPLDRQQLGLS